jgi:hypothetical protein
MDEGRVPKKLMTCGVGAKRRKDRPRVERGRLKGDENYPLENKCEK